MVDYATYTVDLVVGEGLNHWHLRLLSTAVVREPLRLALPHDLIEPLQMILVDGQRCPPGVVSIGPADELRVSLSWLSEI